MAWLCHHWRDRRGRRWRGSGCSYDRFSRRHGRETLNSVLQWGARQRPVQAAGALATDRRPGRVPARGFSLLFIHVPRPLSWGSLYDCPLWAPAPTRLHCPRLGMSSPWPPSRGAARVATRLGIVAKREHATRRAQRLGLTRHCPPRARASTAGRRHTSPATAHPSAQGIRHGQGQHPPPTGGALSKRLDTAARPPTRTTWRCTPRAAQLATPPLQNSFHTPAPAPPPLTKSVPLETATPPPPRRTPPTSAPPPRSARAASCASPRRRRPPAVARPSPCLAATRRRAAPLPGR